MERFFVELIRGNGKRTLAEFDKKAEAFDYGARMRAEHPQEPGIFVCNGYQCDPTGRRYESRWRQYREW